MEDGIPVIILAPRLSRTIIRLDQGSCRPHRSKPSAASVQSPIDLVVALSTVGQTKTERLDHHRTKAGLPGRTKECFIDPTAES